jgi:hypothetical protein
MAAFLTDCLATLRRYMFNKIIWGYQPMKFSLMVRTEMIPETSVIFNHVTRLRVREDFNYFSRLEFLSSETLEPLYVSLFLP